MDDPVLHRKLFREKALRVGALKPRRYQLGAPETGVTSGGLNPFFTQESQGVNVSDKIYTDSQGRTWKVTAPGKYERVYLPSIAKSNSLPVLIATPLLKSVVSTFLRPCIDSWKLVFLAL